MAIEDLKTRDRVGLTIDKELNRKFRNLAAETKIPMSRLIDEAIELLLVSRESR